MSISKFLAIDLGAESGRACVGILDGKRIFLQEIHRFPNVPAVISGHLHWDVFTLLQQVKVALEAAVMKGHGDIQSIGVDSWGVDYGIIKGKGEGTDLPFTYRDFRTNGMMERVFGIISRDEIYSRTGIQPMQINSLYQLFSMKEGCRNYPDRSEKLLFIPDIFNYFLTGEKFSEYTIASTSQLLNATSKTFDDFIFSVLGLPMELMCPIIMPGTMIGKLLPAIAAETGLKDPDIIAVGSHDTASAIAAIPATGMNRAYLSSGTWSLIGIEIERPIINKLSLENNFTNEGGVAGKINFLQNIMGLWLLQKLKASWEMNNEYYSFDVLIKMAYDAKEFKCILNPADDSFLNPPDMLIAIMDFCKKTRQPCVESKGEIVRSIFESLAFKYKSALEKINLITGQEINQLHIVGGGAQNEMLNQFAADAAGIPVVAGPVEATALGNILVQAIAKGKIESLERGREIIGHSFQLKRYFPQNPQKWEEAYKRVPFIF